MYDIMIMSNSSSPSSSSGRRDVVQQRTNDTTSSSVNHKRRPNKADLLEEFLLVKNPKWLEISYGSSNTGASSGTIDTQRDYQYLYQLLNENPELASHQLCHNRRYGGVVVSYSYYPLSFLLVAQAPLQIIQDVYQMYPEALTTCNGYGKFPIHQAIEYNCNAEILKLLIEKDTNKSTILQKHIGKHPIDLLLSTLRDADDDFADDSEDDEDQLEFTKKFQLLYSVTPCSFWVSERPWKKILSNLICNYPKTPKSLLRWLAKMQIIKSPVWNLRLLNLDQIESIIQNLQQFVPALGQGQGQQKHPKIKETMRIRCRYGSGGFPTRRQEGIFNGMFIEQLFARVTDIPPCLAISIHNLRLNFPSSIDRSYNQECHWGSSCCRVTDIRLTDFYIENERECQYFLEKITTSTQLEKVKHPQQQSGVSFQQQTYPPFGMYK